MHSVFYKYFCIIIIFNTLVFVFKPVKNIYMNPTIDIIYGSRLEG